MQRQKPYYAAGGNLHGLPAANGLCAVVKRAFDADAFVYSQKLDLYCYSRLFDYLLGVSAYRRA